MNYPRPCSRCSESSEIAFHWFDGVINDKDALDRATEAFLAALDGPKRLWGPYNKAMVKSEFRGRIRRACAGELRPVDEVKGVDEEQPYPLYEIRWQDVNVTEREDVAAAPVYLKVLVRMYHSEPPAEPGYFIGHHVHEKVVGPGVNINDEQDVEIGVARGMYRLGEGRRWNLP